MTSLFNIMTQCSECKMQQVNGTGREKFEANLLD